MVIRCCQHDKAGHPLLGLFLIIKGVINLLEIEILRGGGSVVVELSDVIGIISLVLLAIQLGITIERKNDRQSLTLAVIS